MAFRTIVNNFTRGELDPRFLAMVDYEGYHKGCRELQNMVCIPQGGSTRRFGTVSQHVIKDIEADTFVTNIEHVRVFGYEYDESFQYFIVIRPSSHLDGGQPVNIAFDIYQDATLIDTVYPPANTYTTDQIRELRWAEWSNRIVLFHEDVALHQIIRTDAATWSCSVVNLKFYPGFDYTLYDNPASPYTASGEAFTPSAVSGASVTVARSAGSSTPFTDNHVGGLIYGNGGVLRITTVNSNISVTGYTYEPFADTTAIRGDEILILEKGWGNGSNVVVAGAARGWPSHGEFYQGRMYAGRWKIEKARASASVVNSAYDFDDWDDDPSTGFSFETGAWGNDSINDIVGYKSLITLGYKGPSASSLLLEGPITPTTIYMPAQESVGSANIDGVILNNMVVFIDKNYKTVYGMAPGIPDTGYSIINLSSLSSHLITRARWADIFDPADTDGRYYLLVNEDGTIACYQTISEENIMAWSPAVTMGQFIDVASSGNITKLLTKRQIITAGVTGSPYRAYLVDSAFKSFVNVSTEIIAPGITPYPQNDSYILFAADVAFTKIAIGTASKTPDVALGLEFEYLCEDGWIGFTPTDTTAEFSNSGEISWTQSQISRWQPMPLNGIPMKFWLRIKRTTPSTDVTVTLSGIYINTENRIFFENASFSVYMDFWGQTTVNASGNITGLSNLAGQRIYVFLNGFPFGYKFVDSSGVVSVGAEFEGYTAVYGIDFDVNLVPMPLVGLLQNGYNLYHPQHIDEAYIDFYESLGITVNGQEVVTEYAGDFLTTNVPVPKTGVYEVPIHKGWDSRQEIRISQSYPAPMTILGIGLTVEVS